MSKLSFAIPLPELDVAALIAGETIAALPRRTLTKNQSFILYPVSDNSPESWYQPEVLTRHSSRQQDRAQTIELSAWAQCEICETIADLQELDRLAGCTIWTPSGLKEQKGDRPFLFVAYLRVYRFSQVQNIPPLTEKNARKIGQLVRLKPALSPQDAIAVLGPEAFEQHCQQLQQRQGQAPQSTADLEQEPEAIARTEPVLPEPATIEPEEPEPVEPPSLSSPEAQPESPPTLQQPIVELPTDPPEPIIPHPAPAPPHSNPVSSPSESSSLDWTQQIAATGNSSNGHEFERLVRRSLGFLGFSNSQTNPKANLDPEATGGAGGLDFYADRPYAIVGECKATKTEKVPDGTPAELIKLGYKILQKQQYDACIKIIVAAGELTKDAEKTAVGNGINVLRPETIEQLVRFKSAYLGSIDLWQLKNVLEQEPFGEQSDPSVNHFLDAIQAQIDTREQILEIIKNNPSKTFGISCEQIHTVFCYQNPDRATFAEKEETYNILIEMASPLLGYIGRQKAGKWQEDRFYFLRDFDSFSRE